MSQTATGLILLGNGLSIREIAAAAVQSDRCYCGNNKRVDYSFCGDCYSHMPDDIRANLYTRLGDGFEESYFIARGWIDENLKPQIREDGN